jgi:signal transduction histidine kinase
MMPGNVEGVTGSTWSYRNDVWWAHLSAALAVTIGLVGLAGASGPGAPVEVVGATAFTAAGFEAKARWPRLPGPLVALWTGIPAVVLNLRGTSEGTMFLLVVAVFFVVLTEPDRRTRLAVGVTGVASPAAVAAFSTHRFGWPFWMMGIAFGWLSAEQMRRFRQLVSELEATRERLAAQAVHLERRRIAADLHDLVGHSLTVVLLYLTGARRQLHDDPAGAASALQEAEEIGRTSLADIRRNVAALRDPGDAALAPTPEAGDLVDLVKRLVSAGSAIDLHVRGDLDALEAIVGVVVYRVVQESLNNASRHAPGAPVRVDVTVGADAVDTSVVDQGGAVEPSSVGGVGLIGMRERVEAIGGTLHAGPFANGWAVRAWVPRPALVERHSNGGQL